MSLFRSIRLGFFLGVLLDEGADVIDHLPGLRVVQAALFADHFSLTLDDQVKEFSVGPTSKRGGISPVLERELHLSGHVSFAVAGGAMTEGAIIAIQPLRFGKSLRRGFDGVLALRGFGRNFGFLRFFLGLRLPGGGSSNGRYAENGKKDHSASHADLPWARAEGKAVLAGGLPELYARKSLEGTEMRVSSLWESRPVDRPGGAGICDFAVTDRKVCRLALRTGYGFLDFAAGDFARAGGSEHPRCRP